jgi:hypothetical protein
MKSKMIMSRMVVLPEREKTNMTDIDVTVD